MEFIWVVECRSTLFFNEVTKKNKLNILLSTLQKRQVEEIEESVNVHYKHLGFTSSLRKDVLIDSNIPTQYSHIIIPMHTLNDKKLLVENVKNGLVIRVKITPTFVWKSMNACGIIWSIHDILANIIYK
jgi:hypothetical protein